MTSEMNLPDNLLGFQKDTFWIIVFCVIFMLMVGIARFIFRAGGIHIGPASQEQALIVEGREIYLDHCARCHGLSGEGGPDSLSIGGVIPPPHNKNGHTWQHADIELMDIVLNGRNDRMPSFRGQLTETEIKAVLTFIQTLWTDEQRDYQDHLNP